MCSNPMLEEDQPVQFFAEGVDFPLDQPEIYRRWLFALAKQHNAALQEVSYVFLSDDALLKLNEQHLQHSDYTDILTFDLRPSPEGPLLSDIFISVDRVRENAADYGVTREAELRRVMAHGLLHLLGFRDKAEVDIIRMRQAENEALELWLELVPRGTPGDLA